MSHFRLINPRVFAARAVQGAIIFIVLYGLGVLTSEFRPEWFLASPVLADAALIALLFGMFVPATQRGWVRDTKSLGRELLSAGAMWIVFGATLLAVIWRLNDGLPTGYALLLLEGVIAVPLAVVLCRWASARWNILDGSRERILVLGSGGSARELHRWIADTRSIGYRVVGFATADPQRVGQVIAMGTRACTDFSALPEFCPGRIDRVVVALEEKRGTLPIEPLMRLRLAGIPVEEATSFVERTSGKIAVEGLLPSWLIFSDGFKISQFRAVSKRLLDIAHGVALLVVTLPLMLLTALAIRLESRGPILFRQSRLGLNGREFNLLKFRSMVTDAEARSGPVFASKDDPRVTRVGRFIRKTRIDELPQLINVLRGDMSFVGPRPERGHFVRQLEEEIPYYRLRLSVRPGLTGWAQVRYAYADCTEAALEKLKFDLYYIKNGDTLFDLWIVLKTVRVVLLGSGAR